MDQLGTFLRQAVYLLPQRHELRESLALALWEKAVGESLAKRTKPLRLHRTTLIVITSSEPWKRELHHLRTEIARKLNECAGFRLIHDLEFRVDSNFLLIGAEKMDDTAILATVSSIRDRTREIEIILKEAVSLSNAFHTSSKRP